MLGVLSWALLLFLGNVLWSWATRRGVTIDLTDDGHFAVYRGPWKKPALLGRKRDLEVRASDVDAGALGYLSIGDGRDEILIDALSPNDLKTARKVLGL